jgi:hypothetical protein
MLPGFADHFRLQMDLSPFQLVVAVCSRTAMLTFCFKEKKVEMDSFTRVRIAEGFMISIHKAACSTFQSPKVKSSAGQYCCARWTPSPLHSSHAERMCRLQIWHQFFQS